MRKRFKIPLGAILFLVLAIGTILTVLYQSHFLEDRVNRFLADRLAAQYGLEVVIGEIDGSYFDGFILKDLLIRYRREADTVTLAFIPQAGIKYKASNLWHRRWIIDSLILTGPQFYLKRTEAGEWYLPRLKTDSDKKRTMPSWEVKHLGVTSATIKLSNNGDSLQWSDISFIAEVGADEGTITLSVDSLRSKASDRRMQVNYASIRATKYQDKLILQDVIIETDSSRAEFSLVREDRDGLWLEAEFKTAHIHLPDIISFFGVNLSGDIDLSGTVYHKFGKTGGDLIVRGDFQNRSFDSLNTRWHFADGILFLDSLSGRFLEGCQIAGYGLLDFKSQPKLYRVNARIDGFNLNNLIPNSFTSDLSGSLTLEGRGFKGDNMIIDIDASLDESYFDRYHFHHGAGQMSITTRSICFFPGFQFLYHGNRFTGEGTIDYRGDLEINGRADLNDLSDFSHQTFIDLPAGRAMAQFRFSGPVKDPDLSGHFESDSVWFYDFYSTDFVADFEIASFIRSKQGEIKINSGTGEAWSFPFDNMNTVLTIDSNMLFIDSLLFENDFSVGRADGHLDYEVYPQRLTLDNINFNLTGREFASAGEQLILIDSSGFLLDHFDIRTSLGKIAFQGRVNYDESLDLMWDVGNISIAPWVELLNDSLEIDGWLSSEGEITGQFNDPDMNLNVRIDSLSYRDLRLGDMLGYFTYEDSTLYIDSSSLKSAEGMYEAVGEFPINLAIDSGVKRFDDRQQEITVIAHDRRLDLAAFVLESVEYITGDFSAEFELTGQPLKPHINGVSSLKNGVIKLIDLRDRLENIEVELEMSDRLITINKATADIPNSIKKTPGLVTAGGTILINDINSYRFAINLKCLDMPLNYEMGDFTGMADATLMVDGTTPPLVSGTIKMQSAEYRENFADESGFNLLTALQADQSWNLDLMVECPSNVWVKNDDINAEFFGNINILRDAGRYNFLGTLEVIRGKYDMIAKTFKFTPGGTITYNNIEEANPELNMIITTRMRSQNRFSDFEHESSYSYELELLISGTLDNPIITGTGDSPISTEAILPALLTGDSLASGNSKDQFTSGLGTIVAGQLTRLGTRSLGVETFEIDPSFGSGFDAAGTRLTIGAYTHPNLYIFGSSYFDVARGQELGAEFRLGRHAFFEGRRDESNLYRFNFKFHWEY